MSEMAGCGERKLFVPLVVHFLRRLSRMPRAFLSMASGWANAAIRYYPVRRRLPAPRSTPGRSRLCGGNDRTSGAYVAGSWSADPCNGHGSVRYFPQH